jgi:hypothetical protein
VGVNGADVAAFLIEHGLADGGFAGVAAQPAPLPLNAPAHLLLPLSLYAFAPADALLAIADIAIAAVVVVVVIGRRLGTEANGIKRVLQVALAVAQRDVRSRYEAFAPVLLFSLPPPTLVFSIVV